MQLSYAFPLPAFNYQRNNRQRTVLAHRFSMELVHGILDEDVVCEHTTSGTANFVPPRR